MDQVVIRLESVLIGSVNLLMAVRIVDHNGSSYWNILALNVLIWIDWEAVLIYHSSIAGVGHLHFLWMVHLVINDWLHFNLSLNLISHLGKSLDFRVMLIDLFFNHGLK